MDDKMKALIAVGASAGAHCQPCLAHHVAKARDLGISVDELREAIAVGVMVNRGAMVAMQKFSETVFEDSKSPPPECCSGEGLSPRCCC
jgi:AhpD family alkylhydroperoxidase